MSETTPKNILGHSLTDKKRIRVSSKRQITIPLKFHALLGMSDEVDCHVRNGALIITPIRPENTGEFAEEILAELVSQGLSGKQLLAKFSEMNRKVRPAVEALLAEADAVASSSGSRDQFSEIFGAEKYLKKLRDKELKFFFRYVTCRRSERGIERFQSCRFLSDKQAGSVHQFSGSIHRINCCPRTPVYQFRRYRFARYPSVVG